MANNVYLVFSERPAQISDADYHAWYTDHAQENIASPGFVSAQRYRVREVVRGEVTGNEQHLALYQYEGPMSTWRTDLNARIDRGDIQPAGVVRRDRLPQLDLRADRRAAAAGALGRVST